MFVKIKAKYYKLKRYFSKDQCYINHANMNKCVGGACHGEYSLNPDFMEFELDLKCMDCKYLKLKED